MEDMFFKFIGLDDLFKTPETFTYRLIVDIVYKSNNLKETVAFQNLSVFDCISDEVNLVFWKYVRSDGEVLTEGNALETLRSYSENLDAHIEKFEG